MDGEFAVARGQPCGEGGRVVGTFVKGQPTDPPSPVPISAPSPELQVLRWMGLQGRIPEAAEPVTGEQGREFTRGPWQKVLHSGVMNNGAPSSHTALDATRSYQQHVWVQPHSPCASRELGLDHQAQARRARHLREISRAWGGGGSGWAAEEQSLSSPRAAWDPRLGEYPLVRLAK